MLEKAIILANRSAALYHMEKFDETLIDVKRSINYGYPKDLLYKLYERQARCYMAKKDYPNTILCFKYLNTIEFFIHNQYFINFFFYFSICRKFITALDDAPSVQSDKRSKMILDAMTMIKMLEKDPLTNKQIEFQKKKGIPEEFVPSLDIPDEKEIISPSIRIDENRQEGRFARAATDIKVGEEILIEKPFVAVLLEKFSKSHCDYCFIRLVVYTNETPFNFLKTYFQFFGLELPYQWHVPFVWM